MSANTKQPTNLTAQQERFLESYTKNGIVQKALNAVGATRKELRAWKQDTPGFDKELADAREAAVEAAEDELRRRGMGFDEPMVFQGQPIYKRDPSTGEVMLDDNFEPIPFTVRKRSDRLLEVYMKANDRKYKDKTQVEHTGDGGGAIKGELTVRYVVPKGKDAEDYEDKS